MYVLAVMLTIVNGTNLGILYFLIEFYFAYIVWLKIVRVPFVT